jgi:hypothetical protein
MYSSSLEIYPFLSIEDRRYNQGMGCQRSELTGKGVLLPQPPLCLSGTCFGVGYFIWARLTECCWCGILNREVDTSGCDRIKGLMQVTP